MKYNIRFANETFTVAELNNSKFDSVYAAETAIDKAERKLDREYAIVVW
jgi:hypothetical protein